MTDSPEFIGLSKRGLQGFLLSRDPELVALLQSAWPEENMSWRVFDRGGKALEFLFTEPPDILVVDKGLEDMAAPDLVNLIKSENVYRQLPVVLCLEPDDLDSGLDWATVEADDFLLKPLSVRELKARLTLTLCRASRTLDANPLTRLPGNTTILQRIQEMVDARQDFALAYADLDNFKSFNDKYGFSRGDEALMMTARVIVNTIRAMPAPFSFVGHVGGDDFVVMLPPDRIEEGCKRILANFDAIVPSFYDQEDRERGSIQSTDRQGKVQTFDLMSLSIAVVFNRDGSLKHAGQAAQIAAGLKKKAKEIPGSSYVLDRRKQP